MTNGVSLALDGIMALILPFIFIVEFHHHQKVRFHRQQKLYNSNRLMSSEASYPHNRSHASLSPAGAFPDPSVVQGFDLGHLQDITQDLVRENEFLAEEIVILNDYLQKNSQETERYGEIVASNDDAETISERSESVSSFTGGSVAVSQRLRKRKKSKSGAAHLELSAKDKLEIVFNELDELKRHIDREVNTLDGAMEEMRAKEEEADEAIKDVVTQMNVFKKDILIGAINPRSGKVIAEKLSKFFDDMSKKKEEIRRKLDMKESALRGQYHRLRQQLNQREEIGDALSKIDFDQLKIENDQMEKTIMEKNDELKRLKMTTGKSRQILSHLQNKLRLKTNSIEQLREEIAVKKKELGHVKVEIETTLKEKESQQRKNEKLTRQHEETKVPDVMNYVSLKSEVDQLRKDITSWERKVEVATGSERVLRAKVREIQKQQQESQVLENRYRQRYSHRV